MSVGIASTIVPHVRNDYNNPLSRLEADSPIDVLARLHCTVRYMHLAHSPSGWANLMVNPTRMVLPIASIVTVRLSLSLRQLFFATSYFTMSRSNRRPGSEGLPLSTRLPRFSTIDTKTSRTTRTVTSPFPYEPPS